MAPTNTNRRLTPATLQSDLDSYNGLQTIANYTTSRAEATPETLEAAYAQMIAKQREETEKQVLFKAAADAARLAE